MINTIHYNDKKYPKFQDEGFASQFAIPYAKHFCKGIGFDIGCNRVEWSLPGSIPIDLNFYNGYDAYCLPELAGGIDYIYSSHCLEHLDNWVTALEYWTSVLKVGGVLFLYLPDYSQEYWRPWNNKKHLHIFTPEIIKDYMMSRSYTNIFYSGVDFNNSFMIVGEKTFKGDK
jgi:hypothetical protein